MAVDPFGAQMNHQHLAAIIAHLQGLSGAPTIPGIGQDTFGVPTQPPSYALPGGPQAQYTLPSSPSPSPAWSGGVQGNPDPNAWSWDQLVAAGLQDANSAHDNFGDHNQAHNGDQGGNDPTYGG